MTVKVSKSAINLREKLAKVDQIDLEKVNNLKMRKIKAGGYALEIDGGGLNILSADPDITQRIDLRKGAASVISNIMGAIETSGTYNQKAEISYNTGTDLFRIESNKSGSTIEIYSPGYKRFTGSSIVAIANSVTPPAWRSTQKVLSLGDYSNFTSYSNLTTNLTHNVYFDSNNDALVSQSGQRTFSWGADSLDNKFTWNIGSDASPTADDPANLVEHMTLDSAGHLIVPAGVTLGTAAATYNADNTLDDYEEGTWIPTFTNLGTATVLSARYTKIGNACTIYLSFTCTSTPTLNSSLFTLPFPSAGITSGTFTRSTVEGGFIEAQSGNTNCYFASTASTNVGSFYCNITFETT